MSAHYTVSSVVISRRPNVDHNSSRLAAQLFTEVIQSWTEFPSTRWCVFSSSVNATNLTKALVCDETPSTFDVDRSKQYDLLFDRVNRVGELLETSPVGTTLRFLDMDINRVANVTCPVYEHKGHLRVALEGHDIATHNLDQVFNDLGCGISLSFGLGEGVEQRGRHNRSATRTGGATRMARLKGRLR